MSTSKDFKESFQPSKDNNIPRLQAHFMNSDISAHGDKWNDLWKEGFVPWDEGMPSPALVDLLKEREDVGEPFVKDANGGKRRKRALVPGCGRGYDVLLLSAFGYDAYGLEISALALEAAKKGEKESHDMDVYKVRNEAIGKGKVTWVAGNFFKDDFLKSVDGDGTFDLLYDYTFLCALPLSLRPAWALRFSQLLSPEGRVICLEFPTYKSASLGGPPWSCPSKVHLAHLQRPGVDLPYENGDLQEGKLKTPTKDSSLQRIAHFQPKESLKKGITSEGIQTDWISVWSH